MMEQAAPVPRSPSTDYDADEYIAAILRDSMTWLGVRHKTHLGRLLGLPKEEQYRRVWLWMRGGRRPQVRYVLRLLTLLMWQWRGYPVRHIRSVDWDGQSIEWAWDGMPESPFEWLEEQAAQQEQQEKNGRQSKRQAAQQELQEIAARERPVPWSDEDAYVVAGASFSEFMRRDPVEV